MSIGQKHLPKAVLNSVVFSKAEIERMAQHDLIPGSEEIAMIKASPDVKRILDEFDDASQCQDALHGLAQQYLLMDEVARAVAIIFL